MFTFMPPLARRSSGLNPKIELAHNYGLNARQVSAVQKLIEARANEIRKAWKTHFGS